MDAKARDDFSETAVDTPAGSLQPWIFRFTLSPLNRRRWENFKVNRRGYWSLWVFLAMFLISLFAEFIANDKPIYIHVNGHSYLPGGGDLSRHGLRQGARTPICSAPPPIIATTI